MAEWLTTDQQVYLKSIWRYQTGSRTSFTEGDFSASELHALSYMASWLLDNGYTSTTDLENQKYLLGYDSISMGGEGYSWDWKQQSHGPIIGRTLGQFSLGAGSGDVPVGEMIQIRDGYDFHEYGKYNRRESFGLGVASLWRLAFGGASEHNHVPTVMEAAEFFGHALGPRSDDGSTIPWDLQVRRVDTSEPYVPLSPPPIPEEIADKPSLMFMFILNPDYPGVLK